MNILIRHFKTCWWSMCLQRTCGVTTLTHVPLHITLPDMTLLNTHHSCWCLDAGQLFQLMLSLNSNVLKICARHIGNLKIPYPAAFTEHAHILVEAKGNIIIAQLKQKEMYDKKHCKPSQFQCDQLILLRNFSRKKVKGEKLTERFLGPYKIINALPHGIYELRNEEGKTTRATGSH